MKLFEIRFNNHTVKRSWATDVLDALNNLGFNDPAKTLLAVVNDYTIISEVRPC